MASQFTVPAKVATAVITVMAGIKRLGKDATNHHQKYDFVSIDKFLEAIGPLCAEAGLAIFQDEVSHEIALKETTDSYGKVKLAAWLTARYGFTLAHLSGQSCGPFYRTVIVPANGAQAFGSAQSYALKQFMRSQFQIPTGDKDDADHNEATPLPSQTKSDVERMAPYEFTDNFGEITKGDGKWWGDTFTEALKTSESVKMIDGLWDTNSPQLTRFREDMGCKAGDYIDAFYAKRLDVLRRPKEQTPSEDNPFEDSQVQDWQTWAADFYKDLGDSVSNTQCNDIWLGQKDARKKLKTDDPAFFAIVEDRFLSIRAGKPKDAV